MIGSKTSNSTTHSLSLKLRFYRQCRLWHGYLSAFAFIALLFFAVTGVALNHPNWFGARAPRSPPVDFSITPSQVQALRTAQSPGELLMQIAAEKTTLYGEFKDGALTMDQVFTRLRGARGSSDLRANLKDATVAVTVERATTVALLNALHRGETAGAAWQAYIDIVGGILIVMSLAGYVIFLCMSTRVKTALTITGASILVTVVLFVAMVK
jgi:hypothetical protein